MIFFLSIFLLTFVSQSGSPDLLLAELAIQEDGVILDQKTGAVMDIATRNEQVITLGP